MKIQEAIKQHLENNMKFRRPCLSPLRLNRAAFYYKNPGCSDELEYYPDADDICADDWEMAEQKIVLTKTDIRMALSESGYLVNCDVIRNFFKLLGFTE